jgi:hypothetical protein
MSKYGRQLAVINLETDELIEDVVIVDKATLRAQQEAAKRRALIAQYRRNRHGLYGYTLMDLVPNQFDGLSRQTVARLAHLATYLGYHGRLMLTERNPLRRSDLPAVLGVSTATAERFWAEVNGKYIVELEDGTLSIVAVFGRGRGKSSVRRIKVYRDAMRSLYQSTAVSKHRYIGYLLVLADMLHVRSNTLCHHPTASNDQNIKPLTMQAIASLVGYAPNQAARLQKELEALTFSTDNMVRNATMISGTALIVSPHLLFQGSEIERQSKAKGP